MQKIDFTASRRELSRGKQKPRPPSLHRWCWCDPSSISIDLNCVARIETCLSRVIRFFGKRKGLKVSYGYRWWCGSIEVIATLSLSTTAFLSQPVGSDLRLEWCVPTMNWLNTAAPVIAAACWHFDLIATNWTDHRKTANLQLPHNHPLNDDRQVGRPSPAYNNTPPRRRDSV